MAELKEDVDRAYIEAGRPARELMTMRHIHDDELRGILERVRKLEIQMMQLRERIHDLGGGHEHADQAAHACPDCGESVPEGEDSCPNCGVGLK